MPGVFCAFTSLHPAAATALAQYAPETEFADVAGDDFAYWREIGKRWDGTSALILVEHDIEIHAGVLSAFSDCASPWCVFPYEISQRGMWLDRGLGCTRFTAECQKLVTTTEIQQVYGACHTCDPAQTGANLPGCWRHIDGKIAAALESRGLRACVHEPPVTHHNQNIGE